MRDTWGMAEENGGAEGARTLDLLVANQALSQLSYSPTAVVERSYRTGGRAVKRFQI